jgi:thioredoxin-related protein
MIIHADVSYKAKKINTMKILHGILILVLVFSASCKNSGDNNFYERTLRKAEKNHKLILLDFGATWCQGCVAYDRYVFKDSSTRVKLDEKFIVLKLDKGNPENLFLIKKYRIGGIPHIIMIDSDERIMGSLNSFYREFVEYPDSFLIQLESIIKQQEKIKKLESIFKADTTNLEAINNLLAAYQNVNQYIGIQYLNNLLLLLYPTPEKLFENNLSKAIYSLREEWNTKPIMAFLKDHPEIDIAHKYEIYQQLLFFYKDKRDIPSQDLYYLRLLKMDPDYYKHTYADFLFENKMKIDTAIILANEYISRYKTFKNFFWIHYLDAHIWAYSGKKDMAIKSYSYWMEENRHLFIKEDDYWSFYFYAKFANIHNVDLEKALEYIQISEKKRNMVDEKILMAEILYKLGRVKESLLKLDESLQLTNSHIEYDQINELIEKYKK